MAEGDVEDRVYDVAIIGCGPVGATLAALLGRSGLRVAVFDKERMVYAQPRAVGFDHDAMRLFQRIGIADALGPHIAPFRDTEFRGCDGEVIQRIQPAPPPWPLSWAPSYSCDQPGLEAVLRGALCLMPNVHLALGHRLMDLVDQGEHVLFTTGDAAGGTHSHSARFVVGCDGASSTVRKLMGAAMDSMDYDEPWIVVDVEVEPEALARLPTTNVQYCEPERPCTHVVCPGRHRRWEFMMLPGEYETWKGDEDLPARVRPLLARWLKPSEGRIWRAAAYRFHALIVREWRRGRVLLAGDSAHQTPPFMGQGMCQGLRDAGNLAWKLEWALHGRVADGLLDDFLDSYEQERRPHVEATTRLARDFGALISERDPQKARLRDQRLRALHDGVVKPMIRHSLIPGLHHGWIAQGAAMAGQVFVQPRVSSADGKQMLLDDLCGPTLRLVCGSHPDRHLEQQQLDALAALAQRHAVRLIVVRPAGSALQCDPRWTELAEQQTVLADWCKASGCIGALVRPDHQVFGAFADVDEAAELLEGFFTPREEETSS